MHKMHSKPHVFKFEMELSQKEKNHITFDVLVKLILLNVMDLKVLH